MASPVTDPALLALLNAPEPTATAPAPATATTADGEGMAPEVTVYANGEPPASQPASGPSGVPVTDPALLALLNAPEPASAATPAAASNTIPAPGQEQSAIPFAVDRFKQGVASLLGLAGAPVSIAGTVLEVAGVVPKGETWGGMAQVTRGWEGLLGVQKLKAPLNIYGNVSKTNEYIGTIAEFMGGSIIPGASAVAVAQRKLATAIVTTLGTVSSATSAVEGKDAGGRLAVSFGLPKAQGEEIGYMLGSLAGPKMVGLAGQAVVKSINESGKLLTRADITGTSPEAQRAAANSLLMKEIQESISLAPDSAENVARAMILKSKVDGFSPNIAQMTDAPGLQAMYSKVANKSPEALSKAAAAEQRNLDAIAAYREKVFPKNSQSLTDPARVKLASDKAVLDMAEQAITGRLRELSNKFRTRVDNEAIGNELRSLYWSSRAVAKGRVDQELGQVYATARKFNIQEDMSDIREGINKIVAADRTTFQDMPPVFAKVLREYPAATAATSARAATMPTGATKPIYRTTVTPGTTGKDTASFEELHSLYKEANKEWIDAIAAGQNTKAQYMKMIRDQLSLKVGKYNNEAYGELSQKFQGYNLNYSKFAHTFREGAGGEIAKRTKAGLATDSEDIVNRLILQSGDKKRGVQDFFQVYGDDVRAAELLHEGMLDNFSKATMRSGTLNPKAAAAWMYKNQAALDELPELKKALGNTTAMADDLVYRQRQLQAQRKILDKTVLAKITKAQDPDRLVQQALGDPRLMKGLLVGANSPEAKAAIARAIVDSVGKQGQSLEFLLKNEAALKPVMEGLGKGHWQNVKDIAEMEQITARTRAPTAVELSKIQDIGEQLVGTSVKGMFSRLKNMATPLGTTPAYVAFDVGGRFFYKVRSEELSKLREHAMFDADTAEVLARLGKKSTYTPKELLDLQRISYNAGANSVAQGLEEQRRERDPAKQPTVSRWGPAERGATSGLAAKGMPRVVPQERPGW